MSNHLKQETSPYLLQHAENPVEWYPWCAEAFERARQEDKPIFLSIGYSTCHWCHVMAHESFEDEAVADLLREGFISIKVDREERPDIDSVYMSVCQAFTGSGGWPMSIFMTWEKKPFFAGTYFPPESRYGIIGFSDLLREVQKQWQENRAGLLEQSDRIMAHLRGERSAENIVLNEDTLIEQAVQIFSESFDREYGGFGAAPKFPTPHNLLFLMLYWYVRQERGQTEKYRNKATQAETEKLLLVRKMAEKTLLQMQRGGIFDQIGGGFSRYSTDRYFLVPHFEKMLYDNALLILAYTAAWRISAKEIYLETARETADYILREMTLPEGGFYSAQDADSEGVEGRYYTFTREEILAVLGQEKGKEFAETFDITEKGNFEGEKGVNIPNLLKTSETDKQNASASGGSWWKRKKEDSAETQEPALEEISEEIRKGFQEEKQLLYEYRKNRTALHLDDKVLLSWNAMMIAALAMLYRVCGEVRYLKAAQRAQGFLEEHLWQGTKEETNERTEKRNERCWQLHTSWRAGKCSDKAFLDDYAYEIAALLELYQATLEQSYLEKADGLCRETVRRFADKTTGTGTEADLHLQGFYLCEAGEQELFLNPKEVYDGAIPSGNSMMAYNLVRLSQLTEEEYFGTLARQQLSFLEEQAQDYPAGHSLFLLAKLLYENPPEQVIIVEAAEELLAKKQPAKKRATEESAVKERSEQILRDIRDREKGISLLVKLVIRPESPEYPLLNGKTTYYICRDFKCLPPRN